MMKKTQSKQETLLIVFVLHFDGFKLYFVLICSFHSDVSSSDEKSTVAIIKSLAVSSCCYMLSYSTMKMKHLTAVLVH